jgi:predicted RNase H-like HicB family nuclease
MKPKYSLIIRWSEEDQLYIAWCPEFGANVKTHGTTYEKAARAGQEVIDLLIQTHEAEEMPLPRPWVFDSASENDEQLARKLFPDNIAYMPPRNMIRKTKAKNVPA